MSDSNLSAIALQREATWGVPAVPVALKYLGFTKESLDHNKTTAKSATIRPDRQTNEAVETGIEAKGGIDFEFSLVNFDELMESALFGTWANVGAVPTLINGVTPTSFILEKKLAAASFVSFLGCMVDQFSMNLTSRQIITGSLSFIGLQGVAAGATIDTSGIVAPAGTGPILSASANVGTLTVAGVAQTSVKSLSFTVNNNLRGNDVISKKTIDEIGTGECGVTGKMEAYFRDDTLLAQFIAHTAVALVVEMSRVPAGAATGDTIGYRFTFGKVRWTKGMPMVSGKNTDVMLPLEFDAEATDGVAATGTLTFVANPADTDPVVIGSRTYTFQTVLTNVAGHVLIGATASDSLDNLIAAINLGAGSGVKYAAATTQHPTVTAAAGAGDTMVVTAQAKGTAGNAIATTETFTNAGNVWGAVTLTGGVDSYTIKIEKLLQP